MGMVLSVTLILATAALSVLLSVADDIVMIIK